MMSMCMRNDQDEHFHCRGGPCHRPMEEVEPILHRSHHHEGRRRMILLRRVFRWCCCRRQSNMPRSRSKSTAKAKKNAVRKKESTIVRVGFLQRTHDPIRHTTHVTHAVNNASTESLCIRVAYLLEIHVEGEERACVRSCTLR